MSFALLGLATSPLSVLVYLTISGIAWGGFMVIYIAVLGDLAFSGSKEKFYALGMGIPLIIYMSLSAIPTAVGIIVPANVLSPVLSIILFLSVIPVLYASETLPETKMRERRLREHVRKVGKLVEESRKTD
jgi:MFS family permease